MKLILLSSKDIPNGWYVTTDGISFGYRENGDFHNPFGISIFNIHGTYYHLDGREICRSKIRHQKHIDQLEMFKKELGIE